MTAPPTTLDRYRGCLLGGAVGDALGAAVEFLSLDEIRERFGDHGIQDPAEAYGRVGAITDDTQMTLFTAEGLLQASDRLRRGIGHPANQLWAAYQRWLRTQGEETAATESDGWVWHGELHELPELNHRRAPGTTCLTALKTPRPYSYEPPIENDRKGCGGIMRAAPCGLIGRRWRDDAQFQVGKVAAWSSHGHPTGYLAAGALASLVGVIVETGSLEEAFADTLAALGAEKDSEETLTALHHARRRAQARPGDRREIGGLGEGWVAEEALAIAAYSVLSHPGDFAAAVRLAVNHGGDSDSTGAIAGNLAGALLGAQAIPQRWLETLELRDTIDRLARAMHARFVEDSDPDWKLWEWS